LTNDGRSSNDRHPTHREVEEDEHKDEEAKEEEGAYHSDTENKNAAAKGFKGKQRKAWMSVGHTLAFIAAAIWIATAVLGPSAGGSSTAIAMGSASTTSSSAPDGDGPGGGDPPEDEEDDPTEKMSREIHEAVQMNLENRQHICATVDCDSEFPFSACEALERHMGRFKEDASAWKGCAAPYRRVLSVGAVAHKYTLGANGAMTTDESLLDEVAIYHIGLLCHNGGLIAEEGPDAVAVFSKVDGTRVKNQDGTWKERRPRNSLVHYKRQLALAQAQYKQALTETEIAKALDDFLTALGDCKPEGQVCILYGQNFASADQQQLEAYLQQAGLPKFAERGWQIVDTHVLFETAYNSGRYKVSLALWSLIEMEKDNNKAEAALAAQGVSPTVRDCAKARRNSHTALTDAQCQRGRFSLFTFLTWSLFAFRFSDLATFDFSDLVDFHFSLFLTWSILAFDFSDSLVTFHFSLF
jgi:hypothetical protein